LLPSGIDVNPKSVEADELVEHAWKVMEPYYHDRTKFVMRTIKQNQRVQEVIMDEIAAAAGSRKGRNPINRSRTSNSGKITSDTGTIEKGS
jgi:alkylation response protein AidB-like acyl-CoA dehydrogenase